MAVTSASKSQHTHDRIHDRIEAAVQSDREVDKRIFRFSRCLAAVDALAPSEGFRELLSSAIHLAMVSHAVPWALDDWSTFEPSISELHDLYEVLPKHSGRWAIPYRGLPDFPVWSALRRHSNHKPYDHHVRALLVSVWARRDRARTSGQETILALADQAIPLLKNWISTLNDERYREKRNNALLTAKEASHTLAEFATAVALLHLKGPERDRADLTEALAVSLPTILGLPPLNYQPRPPRPPRPGPRGGQIGWEEDPTPVRGHLIKVSRLPSPLAEPSAEPEDTDEDGTTITHVQRTPEASNTIPSVTRILAWHRRAEKGQRTVSAGGIFARPHHESLLSEEARCVAEQSTRLTSETLHKDLVLSTAHMVILLTLCTGLTTERVAHSLQRRNDKGLPRFADNSLKVASMLPESAFQPKERQARFFEDVETGFTLALPPTVASILSDCSQYRNSVVLDFALQKIGTAINQLRDRTGIQALSTGRIRKTYAVEIYEASRDFCATSLLSQDTFALSTAPMHYYSTRTDILNRIYRRAIWKLFDDTAATEPETSSRIGSRAVPKHRFLEDFTRKPASALQKTIDRSSLESIAGAQNSMACHVAAIMMAIGGHRPSNALFDIRRWDFDLSLGAAIIADKQSDPAHVRRIIGLGEKGIRQIYLYLRHLQAIVDLDLNSSLTAHIRNRVLKGRAPLLFRLLPDGSIETANLEWFREEIKKAPELPLNYGRHYLACHARELDQSGADLIGVQLGHYESTGHPFSSESPLVPARFIGALNPILDSIFDQQGWRLNVGLADPKERRRKMATASLTDWPKTGDLLNWANRKKAFNRITNARNKQVRAHWRASLHRVQHSANQQVIDTAFRINVKLARLIAYRINERQKVRHKQHARLVKLPDGSAMPAADSIPKIDNGSAAVNELLLQLDTHYADESEKAIAAHNTVARVLMWAQVQGYYSGSMHWPYLLLKPLDPSPFLPGLFRATSQIERIRDCFDELSDRARPGLDSDLAKAALSAVVFAGVDREEVLTGMFQNACRCWRIPSMPDALLVHIDSLSYTVGLRGPAATCFARWQQAHDPVDSSTDIVEALSHTFPAEPWAAGQNVLKRLTSTMEMVNRVERAGIGNMALDFEEGSTHLEPEQLEVLLSQDRSISSPQVEIGNLEVSGQKVPELSNPNDFEKQSTEQIKRLRTLLSKAERDIELKETGKIFRYDRAENPSEREKLVAELEACSKLPSWNWYSILWAHWLQYELTRPKESGEGILSTGSVRTRFFEGEKWLTRSLKRLSSGRHHAPAPDDLESVYMQALEDAPRSTDARICKTFFSLHCIAIELFGIDDLDPSDYWEYWRPRRKERGQVRSRIASDYEIDDISNALLSHCDPDAKLPAFANADRRFILQATLAFHLAVVTGARISEILTRQTVDLLLLGQETAVMIRPNSMKRGKTRSARRLVDISDRIDPIYRQLLADQTRAEQMSWPSRDQRHLWLFSTLEGRPVQSHRIRAIVNQVSLQLTGRTFPWHSLRHRWACEQYCLSILGLSLSELGGSGSPRSSVHGWIHTPRQISEIKHSIGHSRHQMTVSTYLHVPWIFQLQAQLGEWTPHRLASSVGIQPKTANTRISHARHAIEITTSYLDKWRPLRKSEDQEFEEGTAEVLAPNVSARYCRALHDYSRGRTPDYIRSRYTLTQQEIDLMLLYAQALAEKSGIGIGVSGKPAQKRLSTVPKSTEACCKLMSIWEALEDGRLEPDTQRFLDQWYVFLRRDRDARRRLRLPVGVVAPDLEKLGVELRATCSGDQPTTHYMARMDGKDVTTALSWILGVAWIVRRARKNRPD